MLLHFVVPHLLHCLCMSSFTSIYALVLQLVNDSVGAPCPLKLQIFIFLNQFCFFFLFLSSSEICQREHWMSEHKKKCSKSPQQMVRKRSVSIALVPSSRSDKTQKAVDKVSGRYCQHCCFLGVTFQLIIVAPVSRYPFHVVKIFRFSSHTMNLSNFTTGTNLSFHLVGF